MNNNPLNEVSTNLKWLKERTLFLTLHGSRAYGTNTPDSDYDYKGVCVPTSEYYMGFHNKFEQAEFKEPNDMVIFEISKFFKLAVDCNPSVTEILFTDTNDFIICHPLFKQVIERRHEFLSRKARHTFAGYAMSQLKRLQLHRRWLVNPAKEPPTRTEFGLPVSHSAISRDQLMAAEAKIRQELDNLLRVDLDLTPPDKIKLDAILEALRGRVTALLAHNGGSDPSFMAMGQHLGYDTNFLLLLDKEKAFKAKQTDWEHYQQWLKGRNPERALLEAKIGYDGKHASHLVRLLRMGIEILETGIVNVKRPDAKELLEIRNGKWSYDYLIKYAEETELEMVELEKSSVLPLAPDRVKIDALCREIIREVNFNYIPSKLVSPNDI